MIVASRVKKDGGLCFFFFFFFLITIDETAAYECHEELRVRRWVMYAFAKDAARI